MADENTEIQNQLSIQFEDILPWGTTGGDTGLSARLKLKRNFDKIKVWMDYWNASSKFLSIDFFNHVFEVRGTKRYTVDGEEVTEDITLSPNEWPESTQEVTYTITDIKAKYGLWTESFLSALGKNDDGTGGALRLFDLLDVQIPENPTQENDGQALVYDALLGKWTNKDIGGGGVSLSEPLYGINNARLGAPTRSGVAIVWDGTSWSYQPTNAGSVTSVALTAPTGFTVNGSPVTNSGTIGLAFADGYSLPTNAKQGQWDDAYSLRHSHSNKGILDNITSDDISHWGTAYANSHTHSNKGVLDGISNTDIGNWNTAFNTNHTHSNKTVLDGIGTTDINNWNAAFGWGNHAIVGYALAANVYSKTDADSKFLAKTDAASTYLSKSDASNTYLSKTAAGNTYVSIAFFKRLFQAHNGNADIDPNNTTADITDLELLFGTWTESFLSALGKSDDGGNSGTLADLLDVELGSLSANQVLTYYNGKWRNMAAQGGTDMATVWLALAGSTNEQINASHLTTALNGYATQSWVTGTALNGYALQSWVGTQISDMATMTWVNQQGFIKSVSGTFWGRPWTNGASVSGSISAGANGGAIEQFESIELNSAGTLSGYGGFIDFHYHEQDSTFDPTIDYTSRIIESESGVISVLAQLYIPVNKSLRIGDGMLVWDGANNAIKVVNYDGTTAANFYATGGVSALGYSDSGSGGGGASALSDLTDVELGTLSAGQVLTYYNGMWRNRAVPQGLTMNEVWMNLGSDSSYQINLSHLTTALSGYSTPSSVSQQLENYANISSGTINIGNNSITPLTSVSFSNLTSHPTTLSGYGITDAYISSGTIYLGGASITPVNGSDYTRVYSKSGYNANSCVDTGIYLIGSGSNVPSGSQYGTLLVMPYRKPYGNTTTDFATQIFMPNGDDSNYPNALFYRTSTGSTWNTWQRVLTVSQSGNLDVYGGILRSIIDWPTAGSGVVTGKVLTYFNNPFGIVFRAFVNGEQSIQAQRESNNSETFPLILNPLGGTVYAGSNYLPYATNSYDLGSSSYKWKDAYISNSIIIGGQLSLKYEVSGVGVSTIDAGASAYGFTIKCNNNTTLQAGNTLTLQAYASSSSRSTITMTTSEITANRQITVSSDMNLKDVYSVVEAELEDIARTPIFNFKWKDLGDADRLHIGTSAQYIQMLFPNAVLRTGDGTLGLDYGSTALAAAVLTARKVVTHEEQIAALKRRISELESEVELLKAA